MQTCNYPGHIEKAKGDEQGVYVWFCPMHGRCEVWPIEGGCLEPYPDTMIMTQKRKGKNTIARLNEGADRDRLEIQKTDVTY